MPMKITLCLALFKDKGARVGSGKGIFGLNRKQSEIALLWILEAMVMVARDELKNARLKGKKLPPLYKSGVRYIREEGTEDWKDPVTVFQDGFGDCEDLAIWRVAELRNNHKAAKPFIRYRIDPATGMYIYHVMVIRSGGTLEDPSRILGMGRKD